MLLWAREGDVVNAINDRSENPLFLPNIALSNKIRATSRIDDLAIQAMYNDQGIVAIGVAALMTELAVNAANK